MSNRLFGYWTNNWPLNGQFGQIKNKFTDAVDHTPDLTLSLPE